MAFGDALAREASGRGLGAWLIRAFLILTAFSVFAGFAVGIIWEADPPHWLLIPAKIVGLAWLASGALAMFIPAKHDEC